MIIPPNTHRIITDPAPKAILLCHTHTHTHTHISPHHKRYHTCKKCELRIIHCEPVNHDTQGAARPTFCTINYDSYVIKPLMKRLKYCTYVVVDRPAKRDFQVGKVRGVRGVFVCPLLRTRRTEMVVLDCVFPDRVCFIYSVISDTDDVHGYGSLIIFRRTHRRCQTEQRERLFTVRRWQSRLCM